MSPKQKPPAPSIPKPKTPARAGRPVAKPARPAESRWQRTVRYGWDKGGARGGR